MNKNTIVILLIFVLVIGFTLTSAKKKKQKLATKQTIQKIQKITPATEAPVAPPTPVQAAVESSSSEKPVPEVANPEATTAATPTPPIVEPVSVNSPANSPATSDSTISTVATITPDNLSQPPAIPSAVKPPVVDPKRILSPEKQAEELAKLGDKAIPILNQAKNKKVETVKVEGDTVRMYKVHSLTQDDQSGFTPDDRVEALTEIAGALRPFFHEKYYKNEDWEAQLKNANAYIMNPSSVGSQKGEEAKAFIKMVKDKENEIVNEKKGNFEMLVPKHTVPTGK